jgi:WXG100 family type VII secretion target
VTEIKVTFGELTAARCPRRTSARRIAAQLEELKRRLAPLAATWEGQAAADYAAKQRQWDAAAADLGAVLARIGVALGAANDGYQQVERANAQRWA